MQLNFVTFSLRKNSSPKLSTSDVQSLPISPGLAPSGRLIAVYGARDGLEVMHEARVAYLGHDYAVVRIDLELETEYLPKGFAVGLDDLPQIEAVLLKKIRPTLAESMCEELGIPQPGRPREALISAITEDPETINRIWACSAFAHIKCFIWQSEWSFTNAAPKKRQLAAFRALEDITNITVRDF